MCNLRARGGGTWHHREQGGTKQRKNARDEISRRHVDSRLPKFHVTTFLTHPDESSWAFSIREDLTFSQRSGPCKARRERVVPYRFRGRHSVPGCSGGYQTDEISNQVQRGKPSSHAQLTRVATDHRHAPQPCVMEIRTRTGVGGTLQADKRNNGGHG
jgi:hypothetical protein